MGDYDDTVAQLRADVLQAITDMETLGCKRIYSFSLQKDDRLYAALDISKDKTPHTICAPFIRVGEKTQPTNDKMTFAEFKQLIEDFAALSTLVDVKDANPRTVYQTAVYMNDYKTYGQQIVYWNLSDENGNYTKYTRTIAGFSDRNKALEWKLTHLA